MEIEEYENSETTVQEDSENVFSDSVNISSFAQMEESDFSSVIEITEQESCRSIMSTPLNQFTVTEGLLFILVCIAIIHMIIKIFDL